VPWKKIHLLKCEGQEENKLTWYTVHNERTYTDLIRLSKGYYHCDLLSSSSHRLLNLPDTRRTTQRWQSVGRSVGPALIGQAGKETPYSRGIRNNSWQQCTFIRLQSTLHRLYESVEHCGSTEQRPKHEVRGVIRLFNACNITAARNLAPAGGSVRRRRNELAECSETVRPLSSRNSHYGGYGVLTETRCWCMSTTLMS
jgi:hypothetical protein